MVGVRSPHANGIFASSLRTRRGALSRPRRSATSQSGLVHSGASRTRDRRMIRCTDMAPYASQPANITATVAQIANRSFGSLRIPNHGVFGETMSRTVLTVAETFGLFASGDGAPMEGETEGVGVGTMPVC